MRRQSQQSTVTQLGSTFTLTCATPASASVALILKVALAYTVFTRASCTSCPSGFTAHNYDITHSIYTGHGATGNPGSSLTINSCASLCTSSNACGAFEFNAAPGWLLKPCYTQAAPTASMTNALPTGWIACVKITTATYLKRDVGNCNGYTFITTSSECTAAAASLGLHDLGVGVTTFTAGLPYGCYYKGSATSSQRLWLNVQGNANQNSADTARVSLCVSPTPAPTPSPTPAPTPSSTQPPPPPRLDVWVLCAHTQTSKRGSPP